MNLLFFLCMLSIVHFFVKLKFLLLIHILVLLWLMWYVSPSLQIEGVPCPTCVSVGHRTTPTHAYTYSDILSITPQRLETPSFCKRWGLKMNNFFYWLNMKGRDFVVTKNIFNPKIKDVMFYFWRGFVFVSTTYDWESTRWYEP